MRAERTGGKEEETKAGEVALAPPATPNDRGGLLQQAFDAYHHYTDENHIVRDSALQTVLADNGVPMHDGDMQRILKTLNTKGCNCLNFEQFYHVFVGVKIFHSFEKRDRGSIHRDELRNALRSMSLHPEEERLDDMLAMTEAAHPVKVTFPEFLEIFVEAQKEDDPHRLERYLNHALRYWYTGAGLPLPGGMLPISQQLTPLQDFVAGTLAGVAITLVGHPFDTIKVRLQTGQKGAFAGAIDATMRTIRKEGVRGLYKGMGSPMASIPMVNAIVFAAYGQAKSFLRDPDDPDTPLNLWQLALAGSWAGFVNSFIISPVELVKTRLQIQYNAPPSLFGLGGEAKEKVFKGPFDVARHIIKERGVLGLARGMSATIYREMPAYAGQFMVYELVKRWLITLHNTDTYKADGDDLHPLELLLAGGMAGIGAWVASYPMDYVKTQIQAQKDEGASLYKKNRFLLDGGFVDCLRQNVRESGWRSLWKGFGPCVSRAFPANAAGFLAYEIAARLIRERQEEDAATTTTQP